MKITVPHQSRASFLPVRALARPGRALAGAALLATVVTTPLLAQATKAPPAPAAPGVASPAQGPGAGASKLTVPTAGVAATPAGAAVQVPADCAQTADPDKSVTACTTSLKEIGRVTAKDNERVAALLAARAAAFTKQGQHRAALGDVTRALYHTPKAAGLWLQRGATRQALGPNIRCAADFGIALKYDAKNARAYAGRSECYRRLGALPKAITDADEALKLDPKSAAALTSRGYAQLRLGKTDKALADAEEALKVDGNSARAYLTRGLAQEKTDKTKADADVKKAVEIDPALKTEPGLAPVLKRFGL